MRRINFDKGRRRKQEEIRENGGEDEKMSLGDYWNAMKASLKPMIQEDLNAKDWRSAFISFICPHYGYLRHLYRKFTGKLQKIG